MQLSEILTHTEASVVLAEDALNQLDDLQKAATDSSETIENLAQQETDLLASDKPEGKKLDALLRIRANSDVKKSSLAKLRREIAAAEANTIALCIRSHSWLGSIRDTVVASRKQRIGDEIKAYFVKQVHQDIDRILGNTVSIWEVESIERPTFVATRPDIALKHCRELREQFDTFKAFAESEPAAEYITSPAWLQPIQATAGVEAPAGNQIGALA